MTYYRTLDADAAGGEPSYAGLAARLKKLPSYQHPNSQALLDKLERGEIDSEECLHELTQDVIQRTKDGQEQDRQRQAHDTNQQQLLQQERQRIDDEIASNANSDEPTLVDADTSTTPAASAPASPPASTAPTSPVSTGKPSSSSNSGFQQAPTSYAESGLSGSSGSYDVGNEEEGGFGAGPGVQADEDERDLDFEN
ncbi:hypothetical protein [Hymenobacter mucosus]|uniref:Uncharacterized protein n=1 Tax=Hymenobacter mucosus TaxID=1411120 RepID=A0A239A200_9BACT|nr:hypothetical protein [Hymenobacter mucosus]SNR89529.1 hypothetical protein SAMN06269173_110135 [Hymenobacter mucosus]